MKNRKLLWNSIFVFSAIALGVGFSLKPWQVYREQREIADKAQADMRKAEKSRSELMRQKARYESSIGKEELARSQGYRQPNETPVDIPNG